MLLALASISSCDQNRYEIKEDKTGRMVRLDRRTGEISVLEGDKLVKVKGPDEQRREREFVHGLASAKLWPDAELTQLDTSTAELTTSWRDGFLHYQFVLHPEPKSVREGRITGFIVSFTDASGFKTVEVDLPRTKLTRLVNDKGESTGLSHDDSVPCSQDQYERSVSWQSGGEAFVRVSQPCAVRVAITHPCCI